jgi:hypothetical protein
MDEVLNGDRSSNPEKVKLLAKGLNDAVQAHRPWAQIVLDRALHEGLHKRLVDYAKVESVVLVSHDGEVVAKATRVGRRRRDDAGRQYFQQSALEDFSWAELEEWLRMIQKNLFALLVNERMAQRLLSLRALVPDSAGPGDACVRLGTTVNAYLSQAAV